MVTRPVMAIIATLIRLNWRTVVAVTYGRVHWNSATMSTIGEFRCGVCVVVLHNATLPDNGPPYPCFGEGIGKLNGIFAPVSAGAPRRRPHHLDAAAPRCPATCACRSARWRGSGGGSRALRGSGSGQGRGRQAGEGGWHMGVHRFSPHVVDGTTTLG